MQRIINAMNTGKSTYVRGPHASMSIPFESVPKSDTLVVILRVSADGKGEQIVVSTNGTQRFDGIVDDDIVKNGIVFELPFSDLGKSNRLELKFDFPICEEKEFDLPIDQRRLVAKFLSIRIDEK